MDYRIVDVMGHVEVYDSHGEFLFSADTEAEALEDGQIIELYWNRDQRAIRELEDLAS